MVYFVVKRLHGKSDVVWKLRRARGAINGTNGTYTIGINKEGIIFHRSFVPN